jgi:hypothetical protein
MVNKKSLNSQNLKGRDIVVDWILKFSDNNAIPCMDGFGPEVSIFKAAFKHTGLDILPKVADEGINAVLTIIANFITGCEQHQSNFSTLYQTLTSAPYGMRKGIIPLFIAYALRQYKENVVLYFSGKEVELSASILSSLNDAPESYQLLIEAGTQDREKYINALEDLFAQYTDTKSTSINRVYTVVKSMQNWIRALPEYTKKFKCYLENGETKIVSQNVNVVRNELLKFEINSRELLFNTWSSKLSPTNDVNDCINAIREVKKLLDSHVGNYRRELNKKLTALFVPGYQGGLSHSVISWYKKLPEHTKKHVFDVNTNELLSIANSLSTYDDEELLNNLVSAFVSIAIEDWSDNLADQFLKEVTESIAKINEYKGQKSCEEKDCRVAITISGVQLEKTFSAGNISPLGKTALNNLKSVFDDYNGALEPDEQLAILANLIGDIIH